MRRWLLHNVWAVPTFGIIWCVLWCIFDAFTGRWFSFTSTGLAGIFQAWVLWYYCLRKPKKKRIE